LFQPVLYLYQCIISFRFEVEYFSIDVVYFSDPRTCGTDDLHRTFRIRLTHSFCILFQIPASRFQMCLVFSACKHCQQIFHRRIPHQRTVPNLFLIKCRIILRGCRHHRVMFRTVCLDHSLSFFLTAPGSSDRLRQQLERPLSRPVIIAVKRHIRRQHSDQRHIREIVSFYDHLGSHQHIRLFVGECGEDLLMSVFFPGRIHIHAEHSRLGKAPLHDVLDLLGPRLKFSDMSGTAFRADIRLCLLMSAVMADHFPAPVKRKRHVAVRTFYNIAALPTGNKSRIPSPVQKQHDLFMLV